MTLSDDAKLVLGTMWGSWGGVFKLAFHMKESKPSARMKAALDELVREKVLQVKSINMAGGVEYSMRNQSFDLSPFTKFARKTKPDKHFNITEPL